ncbi:MAG: vitamin B12-dependent ribonucleotide reductase, partial [Dehalococcoidia bacterium]|nr:vitamin B12-dependent ribonucleotide reductase [Dehalococcoidia bacterium]
MATRKPKSHTPKSRAREGASIVKAIFDAAESMGIADQNLVEQLTGQVLQRLGAAPTLPGMEDLVAPQATPEMIMAAVKEVVPKPAPVKVKAVVKEVPPPHTPTEPGTLQLTENAVRVLERRYLRKDDKGQPTETAEQMFRRVAQNIAKAELLYDGQEESPHQEQEFYNIMTSLEFLPNSPTLMNAGRDLQQLSACFVLPVGDSMEDIFDAVKYTALIQKSGGGTGFSFSRLRPEGDFVGSTSGVASGPVSFMKIFDVTTEVTKQGGTRRGANMGILSIHHPDIREFITAKADPAAFINFNISVAATDSFMQAVESDTDYDLINPRTGQVHSRLRAREVFDLVVDSAWSSGDPGVVFIDRINETNPTPHLGSIEATNPCGEQPLLPYESCNLGSINLARMVRLVKGHYDMDWDKLERVVTAAVRFLDDVIDMNSYPTPQIAEMTRSNRKIGLGVMGFADALLQLGIPYDSEEALVLGGEVMAFISQKADAASEALGGQRGTFPTFPGSRYDSPGQPRLRNSTRTTIAPTGTLSIIAGCSSGIEPLYALYFERNILDNQRFVELNPIFEDIAREEGFHSQELIQTLADGTPLKDIKGVPERVNRLFVTAHDVTPEWHVRMQAAFQNYTDNAVSKTVNLPHHTTREDVSRVYHMAFKQGLKGITIFRDGSKGAQVLSVPGAGPGEAKVMVEAATLRQALRRSPESSGQGETLTPRRRGKELLGVTEKVTTGCGNIYVTVNSDGQGVCELFASLGKAGGCASAQLEATSRLTSMALRSGVDIPSLVKHLKGIRCSNVAWDGGHAVLSCADAIARVLEKHQAGLKAPEAA